KLRLTEALGILFDFPLHAVGGDGFAGFLEDERNGRHILRVSSPVGYLIVLLAGPEGPSEQVDPTVPVEVGKLGYVPAFRVDDGNNLHDRVMPQLQDVGAIPAQTLFKGLDDDRVSKIVLAKL